MPLQSSLIFPRLSFVTSTGLIRGTFLNLTLLLLGYAYLTILKTTFLSFWQFFGFNKTNNTYLFLVTPLQTSPPTKKPGLKASAFIGTSLNKAPQSARQTPPTRKQSNFANVKASARTLNRQSSHGLGQLHHQSCIPGTSKGWAEH